MGETDLETLATQLRELLEEFPLYRRQPLNGRPRVESDLAVRRLELTCPTCKLSRPFVPLSGARKRVGPPVVGSGAGFLTESPIPSLPSNVYSLQYYCSGCGTQSFRFFVELHSSNKGCWARKVGQLPPMSVEVSPELKETLKDSAVYLERARMCLSQNYGLGACTYMRRLLEDKTHELLTLVRDALVDEGGHERSVAAIEKALAGKDFKTKAKVARRYAPSYLLLDGSNPFSMIHDFLSRDVHRASEDECSSTAAGVLAAVEHVVVGLARQKESRAAFRTAVSKIAKRPTPSPRR